MCLETSTRMNRFLRLYRAMSASVVEAFCFSNPLVNAILHRSARHLCWNSRGSVSRWRP